VVVVPIDEQDVDRRAVQCARRFEPAESRADDDDARA
jgi:hypothetical protein